MNAINARPFAAGRPAGALHGTVRVPGDKSISHRALMFGALAAGRTTIHGLLEGEDVLRTAAAMRALGAEIGRDGAVWHVTGRGALAEPADVLDMGNSGTGARLLTGILAGQNFFSVLTGDASLRRRPMRRVTEPLAASGARFASREGGRLPLAIEGVAHPRPIDYRLPVASAQVKSAILLCGLNADGVTRVVEPEATRDHSENMLRHFGATVGIAVEGAGRVVTLQGRPSLRAADIVVPGDPSSAAFLLAAAAIVPGSALRIMGIGLNPLRTGFLACLREMGAGLAVEHERVEGGEPVGDLVITQHDLVGIEVPPGRAPSMIDEFPVLAVVAACARGTTRMRGLHELRVKESDRLAATAALLAANGVRVEIEGDDLIVHGAGAPPAGGGVVLTHMDHRLAMSALVLGLATAEPVRVDDAAFIDTSFPGFVALINQVAGGPALTGA